MRSSLEARVLFPDARLDLLATSPADLAEMFIVSAVEHSPVIGLTVERTALLKCGRCWRLLPEVVEDEALCGRCAEMVGGETENG